MAHKDRSKPLDFLPTTVTLTPELLRELERRRLERRLAGTRHTTRSALVREALVAYFGFEKKEAA